MNKSTTHVSISKSLKRWINVLLIQILKVLMLIHSIIRICQLSIEKQSQGFIIQNLLFLAVLLEYTLQQLILHKIGAIQFIERSNKNPRRFFLSIIQIIVQRSKMDSDLNSNLNKGALQQYKIDLKLPFLIRRGNFNRGRSYQRDGHWNQKERLKYSVFLMYFRQVLQDPIKKRKVRVYQMMSDVLLTRNAHQCRSHHQKMENYRKTIDNIIQSVAEKYEPNVFQELVQKYSIFIKMILDNKDKYQRGKDRKQSQSKQISSSQQKGENVQGAYQIRREKIDERKEKIEQRKEEQESLIQLQEAIQDEQDLQIDLKGNKEQNRPTDETYRDAADQKQQEDIPAMGFSDLKEEDLARGYFFQEPQQQQQVVYNLQVEPQPSIQPPQSFNSQPQGSLNSVHQPVLVSHTQAQSDAYGGYSNYALDLQSKYYEQQIGALEIKKKWHKYNCEQLQKQIATERQNIKYCQQTIDLYRKTLLFFQAHTEG